MIKSILKPTRPVEVDWVNVPGSMLRQSSSKFLYYPDISSHPHPIISPATSNLRRHRTDESSTTSSRNGSDKSNGSGDDASSVSDLAGEASITEKHFLHANE